MCQCESLIHIFPIHLQKVFEKLFIKYQSLQEIRLRVNHYILIYFAGKEFYITLQGELCKDKTNAIQITKKELDDILLNICNYSIYAYEDEIKQGFLTIIGGHRIGLAGQVVMENNDSVRIIKYISYMNIRISHQIIGVADNIIPKLYKKGDFLNTLIISPPGCGKTTLLRDIVRQVSDGNIYGKGRTVGVVDERSEIGGSYMGILQNNLGERTDVLDRCPKEVGMMMLIRSMAPAVVAIDELGSMEEIEAMQKVASCGSKMLVTIHGYGVEELIRKNQLGILFQNKMFDRYIVLKKEEGKCVIQSIYNEDLKLC